MKSLLLASVFVMAAACPLSGGTLSGQVSEKAGFWDKEGRPLTWFESARFWLRAQGSLGSDLSALAVLKGYHTRSDRALVTGFPSARPDNLLDLEEDRVVDGGRTNRSLRLNRAFLKWSHSRWDASVGRQDFPWGVSKLHQPTHYFSPLLPLVLFRENPLGSDSVGLSHSLWANTSLEGAVRWLRNGRAEWVLRLENQGIGLGATPSFVRFQDRDGWGLEVQATFKHFQARFEGVHWKAEDGASAEEWVGGISTAGLKGEYGVEFFRDGSGRILGPASSGDPTALYFSFNAEKTVLKKLKLSKTWARSFGGGRTMVWPKATWKLSDHWDLGTDGHWMLGSSQGPLAKNPTRVWIFSTYNF